MEHDARAERLERVLADTKLGHAAAAVPLSGFSNDTWRFGSHVLRICWNGDVQRLEREASVAADLPPEVRYPPLVAAGRSGELAWTVTRWVEGVPLAEVWPRLSDRDRAGAVDQLAQALAALHQWTPRGPASQLVNAREAVDLSDPVAVVGATLNPLPLDRATALAGHARSLPFVRPQLVDDLLERLRGLAVHDPYIDTAGHVVVHGDAHLNNVLWNDGRLVALLDLEWVRLGPRDLELEPFLRAVDWSGQEPELMPEHEVSQLLGWLAGAYPGLFASPNLIGRLWLYQLTFTLRELFTWHAATAPPDRLAADHPLNLLPKFVESSDHLERLLAGAGRPRPRGAGRRTPISKDSAMGAGHAGARSPDRHRPPLLPGRGHGIPG
ncbi:phosphotransferase family protein [Catenulispora pinisilvae]|uniref:phosphotransferase family protein n=1 Tax=Catenulispora pinisilvae TaxID=2705253 RepID=UPI0018915DBB|nr:phosphotransferase [Catenulispora pinisilvae]